MADNKVKDVPTSGAVDQGEAIIQKAKGFWAKFSKPIIYVGSAIILLIGGWFAYQNLYKQPKEVKGEEALFQAEQLFDKMAQAGFNKDTINLVLNGGKLADGSSIKGVLNTISKHGGTDAANRAHYMAGACYLQNKEFDKAIKQLKEYDGNGANQLQSMAYAMIGDAYAELKKNDDALSFYKKAATVNEKDEFITPDALMKAAMYCEVNNKPKDAIELYQKIKDNYPQSAQAQSVDKYLARLGVTDNK
jgi:tetratricopeptide (TPR) repeat protein